MPARTQRSIVARCSSVRLNAATRLTSEKVPNLPPVPLNGFVGDPIHRVDIRFQQRVSLAGEVKADGILEVFNVFNRANYGSYGTDETSPRVGRPNYSANLAYAPRTLQLGFRLTF